MIAAVRHFATEASPCTTHISELQVMLREETQKDFMDQRRRELISSDVLRQLLSLQYDDTFESKRMNVRLFLSSTQCTHYQDIEAYVLDVTNSHGVLTM